MIRNNWHDFLVKYLLLPRLSDFISVGFVTPLLYRRLSLCFTFFYAKIVIYNTCTMRVFFQTIFNNFVAFGKIETTIKAIFYWVIVVVGSLIHDFHRPPESYFSDKENVFNVVFVKSAVAWVFAALTPFVILTSCMKSQRNTLVFLKDVSRLVIVFAVWYVVIGIFDFVLEFTGVCEGSELFSTIESCRTEGLIWKGFDLSGHCFLLTYLSLVMSEEMQAVCFGRDKTHSLPWKRRFRMAELLANFFFVCCCLLMLLWEVMLVCTSIYFHTVETKVIGTLAGIAFWAVTYKFWYEKEGCFPGIPTKL